MADLFSLTNDGHAILREIDVAHPAAKSMIELSRTQDEEVGDGTTSVIILGMSSDQNTFEPILMIQLERFLPTRFPFLNEISTLSSSFEHSRRH
jgi:T-complex protein 1 subunit gamma